MGFLDGIFGGGEEDDMAARRRRVMENAQQHRRDLRAKPVGGGNAITVPIYGPAEQRQIANDMANQTMSNIQRENDSRVSQRREMRRMAHEQELARINAQAGMANAAADRDAALIRALLAD